MSRIQSAIIGSSFLALTATGFGQTVADFFSEQAITADEPSSVAYFGDSVDLDGDTAIIGAPFDRYLGAQIGSAYVYTKSPTGDWSSTTRLVNADPTIGCGFGQAVAVSGDTVIVGAPFQTNNGFDSGSAYIFERQTDGTWLEVKQVDAADGEEDDRFGYAVALSGNVALIGAYGDNDSSGSVYVYERQSTGSWTFITKFNSPAPEASEFFGAYLDLSGDTAVICQYDDVIGYRSGSVYVLDRQSDGIWSMTTRLTASDGAAYDYFGRSLAISGDQIIVGADSDDDNGFDSGSAYIFTKHEDGTWNETAKLLASDGSSGDIFGSAVAISGNTALVGAKYNNHLGFITGSAYVFERKLDGSWHETIELTPTAGMLSVYGEYGRRVALMGDTILVGAGSDDSLLTNSGKVYFYEMSNVINLDDSNASYSSLDEALPSALSYDRLAVRSNAFDINGFVRANVPLDFIAVEPIEFGPNLMFLPEDGSTFAQTENVPDFGYNLLGRLVAPENGELILSSLELNDSAQLLQNNCTLLANGRIATAGGTSFLRGEVLATEMKTGISGVNRVAGDTRVFSDYFNAGATIIQEGILYIYGDLENTGTLTGEFNNGLAGGGTPEPGDGFSVGGNYSIGVDATLSLPNPVWWLRVGGDLDIAIDTPQHFAMSEATIELNGLAPGLEQTLETLSADFGATESGFDPSNFPIGTLRIANGSNTRLVNTHQNTTNTPCEVLYTETLVIEAGASLTTAGCQIYTKELILAGTVDDSSNIVIVTACIGDINGDDIVNGVDLSLLLGAWNSDVAYADLNSDGIVNGTDLTMLLGAWGLCSN